MILPRLIRLSVGAELRDAVRKAFELRELGTPAALRASAELFTEVADAPATSGLGKMAFSAHAASSSELAGDYTQHAFLVERAVQACSELPSDMSHLLTSILRGPTATALPQ